MRIAEIKIFIDKNKIKEKKQRKFFLKIYLKILKILQNDLKI